MSETQLLNLLNHYLIREFQNSGPEGMCVNEFLPLCAALVYPYRNEKIELAKGVIAPIITSVLNFTRKKDLVQYSLQGLRSYFKVNWLPKLSFDEQKQLLKCVSLIVKIEDTGYFSIKDNEKVHNAYLNLPNLPNISGNYREESYETVPPTQVESNSTTSCESQTAHPVNQLEDTTLVIEKQPIEKGAQKQKRQEVHNQGMTSNKPTDDHPFCELYNKLLQKRGDAPTYTWQWNLSIAEYEEIKSLLKEYSSQISEIISRNTVCCKLIQLYISEWYKREYNGNDSNNAFSSIGVNEYNTLPERICRQLGIDENKVYKSRNIDGSEIGQNEWLYTIYVDGGLPLKYLSNPTKATNLKNTIYEILCEKDNENSLDFVGDDLDDLCGNGVVNQSYRARILYPEERDASIYDFIQEFILTENLQIEGFENFKDIIKDAKQRAKDNKKKFEVRMQVFKTNNYFLISPLLFLKSEHGGNNYSISPDRLNAWGVTPDGKPFELYIKCGEKTLWREYYEVCLNGDYVTRSRSITYSLPNDKETMSLLSMPWKLVFQQGDESPVVINGAIENKMAEQGYLQMYDGDFYTWTSKSSNNYNHSAILFNKSVVNICDPDIQTEGHDLYGWVEFDESIQLEIEGKIHTQYCKAGQLIAVIKKKHSLSKYHNGLDDDCKRLTLINVGEAPKFDVQITKYSVGEIISKSISSNDIKLEYRKGTNGDFHLLSDQSINEVGYYQLRLTYSKTNKSIIILCFALNENARVHSELNNPRTDFHNFGAVNISCKDTTLKEENDLYRKYWTNQLNYNNPIAFYRIEEEDGESAFELRIPQPIDAIIACNKLTDKIFFIGKGVGKNSKEKPASLPILLADRYYFYKLPDKELYTSYNPIDGWEQAFNAFLDYDFRDNTELKISDKSYFRLRTFSHTFNFNDCIPNGLKHLSFVFVPTESPKDIQPLRLDDNGQFELSSIEEEGVIVQKIDYDNPPLEIIKPIYFPGAGNSQQMNEKRRRQARNSRIQKYHDSYTNSMQDAIEYFKIAIETGMYFGSFDALLGLMMTHVCDSTHHEYKLISSSKTPTFLAKFYHQYYDDCMTNGVRVNYDALWRLADEFLFDWTLIPRGVWMNEFNDNFTLVTELFGHRYLNSDANPLTQWLYRCYTTYMLGKQSIPEKMNELNIYIRTITEEYGRGRNSQNNADFWSMDIRERVPIIKWLRNKEKHNEITKFIS